MLGRLTETPLWRFEYIAIKALDFQRPKSLICVSDILFAAAQEAGPILKL